MFFLQSCAISTAPVLRLFVSQRFSADQSGGIAPEARWFIAMRWRVVAVGTVVTLGASAQHALPLDVCARLLFALTSLAGLNACFAILAHRESFRPPVLLALQVYVDLAILTIILHFTGGVENPLSLSLVIHVVLGGILLSRRQCYTVATVASALFILMAWGEWSGVLHHYFVPALPHGEEGWKADAAQHTFYVAGVTSLQSALFFFVAYVVTTLVARARSQEAQMMRTAKLAAVGELAGNVAHEVNNPIAILSAKARLLLADHRDGMSAKVMEEIGKIIELADRVARIAQGLLSYCRPSPARRELVDILVPIRKALSMVEQRSRSNSVRIEDRLGDAILKVRANAGEIEEVFLNLFLNALDAMPGGGVLTMSTAIRNNGSQAAPSVEVAVADTGIGIPPEIQGEIFEPFFTSKEEERGTGLGLAICLGIIRSHGGTIAVESEPGRGTGFTVRLPLAQAESEAYVQHG